jgi:ankyrin repeat protein
MDLQPPPFRSPLSAYEQQADILLAAHRAADPAAIDLFHHKHPRFLDQTIKWRPKFIPDSDIRDAALSLDDARLAIARNYDFPDWRTLIDYVDAVSHAGPVHDFEAAVEAVVAGDLGSLQDALRRDPALIHARSSRVCCFDPPVHRATLLHYIAANGVEAYRQKTPGKAVEIARTLLVAGAEPDALADMYGTPCTTMSMLVSSDHPARAGLQVALAGLLLDFGAAIEGHGGGKWERPLFTALAFGMGDVAKLLAERGARIDLPAASGLGLASEAARLLSVADEDERRRALSLAAQQGHPGIVALLLDTGLDPNRFNPQSNHPHSTPLHQAVLGAHEAVVRLLVARGAQLDIRDTIWHGTPLGWAIHGGCRDRERMIECLRELGAVE